MPLKTSKLKNNEFLKLNDVVITKPASTATLTLSNNSSLITIGAFSTTLTSTATTAVTLPTTGTLSTLAGAETLTNKTMEFDDNVVKIGGTRLMSTSEEGSADVVYLKNNLNVPYLTIAGDNQGVAFLGSGEHQLWAYDGYLALGGDTQVYDGKRISPQTAANKSMIISATDTSDSSNVDFMTITSGIVPTLVIDKGTGTINANVSDIQGISGYISDLTSSTSTISELCAGSVSANAITNKVSSNLSSVSSGVNSGAVYTGAFYSSGTATHRVAFLKAGGTAESPTTLAASDTVVDMRFMAHNGTDYKNVAGIDVLITDNPASGSGGSLFLKTTGSGTNTLQTGILIDSSQNSIFYGNVTLNSGKNLTLTSGKINKLTITPPTTSATLTIVDGSSLITSGAYAITLTASAATNVTLPTTGTISTLAGAETLTNKTIQGLITVTTEVTGASTHTTNMAVGTRYISSNSALESYLLPSTSAIGDRVEIIYKGAGGWKITQGTGQQIFYGDSNSTISTGNLTPDRAGACVTLVCVTANTFWRVVASHGSMTPA